MTPKYWFRIIFGMLAIFTVGMLVRSGLHKGKRAFTEVTHGSGPITVPLLGMSFKLDDVRLGSLQKLRIERDAPKQVAAFRLYGTLDDDAALAKLDGCRLTVTNAHDIDENTAFRCASVEDSTSEELVQFGSVTLQPSGREFVLLIPESVRRDMQREGAGNDSSDGDNDSVEVQSGEGTFDLKVNGKSVISSKFDSTGGRLLVHGDQGKEVVDLKVKAPPPPPPAKKP